MPITLDGTGSITGLTTTGISAVQQLPAGSVIQVVNATFTTVATTSSTSFVTTGFSVTITPKFATSKIQFITSASMSNTANNATYVTVFRNSTNISPSNGALNVIYVPGTGILTPTSVNVSDSPATISATTYTVYFKVSGGGAISYGDGGTQMTLTAMEIAA